MDTSSGYRCRSLWLPLIAFLGCGGTMGPSDAGSGSSKEVFRELFQNARWVGSQISSENRSYSNTKGPALCKMDLRQITEQTQDCDQINPTGLVSTSQLLSLGLNDRSFVCDVTLSLDSPISLPSGSSWQLSMWRAHNLPSDVSFGIEYEFSDGTKFNALAISNFKAGPSNGNEISTDVLKNSSGAGKQLKFIHFTARGSVSVGTPFGICLTKLTLTESTK